MAQRAAEDPERIVRRMSILFSSNFGFLVIIYMISFVAIAFFWVSILGAFFTSQRTNLLFAHGLDPLNIVIGFIYICWLAELKTCLDGLRRFARFCNAVQSFARYYAVFDGDEGDDHPPGRSRADGTKLLLKYFIYFYAMHSREGAWLLWSKEKWQRESELDEATCRDVVMKKLETEMLTWVKVHPGVLGKFDAMVKFGEKSRVSRLAALTALFRMHIEILLILFFVVWLPIQLWARFDDVAVLLLYPLVSFALAFPQIAVHWIGDPFRWDSVQHSSQDAMPGHYSLASGCVQDIKTLMGSA